MTGPDLPEGGTCVTKGLVQKVCNCLHIFKILRSPGIVFAGSVNELDQRLLNQIKE